MPLIPFPDVPMSAGVPPVPYSPSATYTQTPAAGLAANTGSQTAPGLTSNISATSPNATEQKVWQIVNASDGAQVIQPDSMVAVEIKETSKISTYPVENGGFAAYNKVAVPFQVRVTMTCGGAGALTRENFLKIVEAMKVSVNLYTIITPFATYQNANLTEYSHRHTSTNGASLVVVEAMFEEVRQTAQSTYQNTAQPSGSDPVSTGQVSLNNPSAYVSASFSSRPIQ